MHTPTQRLQAALAEQAAAELAARQRRADKLALERHTTAAQSPAGLVSRQKSLQRELHFIELELRFVAQQLAMLHP